MVQLAPAQLMFFAALKIKDTTELSVHLQNYTIFSPCCSRYASLFRYKSYLPWVGNEKSEKVGRPVGDTPSPHVSKRESPLTLLLHENSAIGKADVCFQNLPVSPAPPLLVPRVWKHFHTTKFLLPLLSQSTLPLLYSFKVRPQPISSTVLKLGRATDLSIGYSFYLKGISRPERKIS